MIKAQGIAHAVLTVSNINQTKDFYQQLLDTIIKMDDESSFNLLKVGIPCWFVQWEETSPDDTFSERRVGLDHIAFEVDSIDTLEAIVDNLHEMGIATAGIERFDNKYPYVAFRDPDNIQTEFFLTKEI
jgi:catechol 2,3-dioxygenase-like lactoylglutathione lyase family enzyme